MLHCNIGRGVGYILSCAVLDYKFHHHSILDRIRVTKRLSRVYFALITCWYQGEARLSWPGQTAFFQPLLYIDKGKTLKTNFNLYKFAKKNEKLRAVPSAKLRIWWLEAKICSWVQIDWTCPSPRLRKIYQLHAGIAPVYFGMIFWLGNEPDCEELKYAKQFTIRVRI